MDLNLKRFIIKIAMYKEIIYKRKMTIEQCINQKGFITVKNREN